MAEKVRRRQSKWDVAAEFHMETEIKHDNTLLVKVDDSCIELSELKQENHSCSQILSRHEAEPCLPMNVAEEHHVETGIKHENALPGKVDDFCIELAELNHESHDCSQILRPSEAEPRLPMNVDGSDMDESDYQSGQIQNNNITHSDNFCEKPQNSKLFDLEGDCKDSFKKQDLELASQGQTMTDYSHYQDKPLKGINTLSPGPDERTKMSENISPTDGWSRSGRYSFKEDD